MKFQISLIADFVIYLGDVITANNLPIANASLYWDRALSLTRNKEKPWSTVFGNHDDALFEWPSEWFSATGIPQVNCPSANVPFSGKKGQKVFVCFHIYCHALILS